MRIKNNQKGSTMVELMMVMTLLLLFGITIYTLIYSGVDTQERIMDEKEAQTDARIALSYINVRLRQNDSVGKIAVEKLELTGENAIVIRERTLESEYDTWIYSLDGELLECLVSPDEEPTYEDSFYIVDTEGLRTELDEDGRCITNTIYYEYGGTTKSISSSVSIRSF